MDWVVKLGIIGSVASIIALVKSILDWWRTDSKQAKWITGVSCLLGVACCYIAISQYHSVLDLEFTTAAGTRDVQTFLRELSLGDARVSIEPSSSSDIENKHVKIKVPALKNISLKYALDKILIPQMPGPKQWTYEIDGKTIMIKRR